MYPILACLGPYCLRTTGVFTGSAAFCAFLYMRACRRRAGLSLERLWELTLRLAAACFVGAAAADALFFGGLRALLRGQASQNGLFYGSFWASVGTAALFCRARGLDPAPLCDVLAEAATLGLAIKRWGCLLNGCCRGVPARAPWALAFTDPASRVPRALLGVPLHPVQAYEALLCLALFAAGRTVLRERLARPGASFAYHAAGYALIRLALEPFRAATPGLLDAGLGTAQWLSLASGAGALLLSRRWRRA